MRIALIHALAHSLAPIEEAFVRLWPEVRRTNLLDDSLSADLARDGAITPGMTARFLALAKAEPTRIAVVDAGADEANVAAAIRQVVAARLGVLGKSSGQGA